MLRFTVILLLAFLGYASCCCFPDQWEANEGILSGSADDEGNTAVVIGQIKLAFDAKYKRIRADESITTGNDTRTFTILELFQQNVQFIINNGTCTRSKLEPWSGQNCIPDNATTVSKYSLGQNPKIDVVDYTWSIGPVQIVMTVTSDMCIPVVEKQMGDLQGVQVITALGFQGITPGIKDPTVFVIPDICKGANVVETKGNNRTRRSVLF